MDKVKKAANPSGHKLPVAGAKVSTMPEPATAKMDDYEAREKRYKIEDALGTIERAEKFKADKSLMRDVKKMAKDKMKMYGKLC